MTTPAFGALALSIMFATSCASPPSRAFAAPLRVCADPNNLPFTDERGNGFENRIAELVAHDFGTRVEYTWWAQRRGFVRHTLNAHTCDLIIGLPTGVEMALTTRPYYRSTYVFVTRTARHLRIRSLDDRQLTRLRIGVPMIGDDGANPPPAHALARRGIVSNVVGYSVFGNYRTESPPSELIAAVARDDVDVAIAWGPLAGYFGARQREPLDVAPVAPQIDEPRLPLVFDMSIAVRRGDTNRQVMLDGFLERRRDEIDTILAEFRVPRVDVPRTRESF